MQAVNQLVLRQISEWFNSNESCWLATVIATYGSSPRPVGSLMACNQAGKIVGSLSGGCVEDDLLEKLKAGKLAAEKPQFFRYGEMSEEAEKLGLPCGGNLEIVVEPLRPTRDLISNFEQINQRLDARKLIERSVNLLQGTYAVNSTNTYKDLTYNKDIGNLVQILGPRFQLFLIGASSVSRYTAEFAQALDYQVTVCDPRKVVLDEFDVEGVTRICNMPDDAIREHADDEHSAIIALTHDPRIDDMGMMEALETDAFYIGAMGSSRTSDKRIERLRSLGVSEEGLARLHAPIGLPIGSKTPPEIAISILAELTLVRKKMTF